MIKVSSLFLVVSAMFIIGGMITGFGPFYVAALVFLLTGLGVGFSVLQDEAAETEKEVLHLRKTLAKMENEIYHLRGAVYREGFKDAMAEARTMAEMEDD